MVGALDTLVLVSVKIRNFVQVETLCSEDRMAVYEDAYFSLARCIHHTITMELASRTNMSYVRKENTLDRSDGSAVRFEQTRVVRRHQRR